MIHIAIFEREQAFADMLSEKILIEFQRIHTDACVMGYHDKTALMAASVAIQLYILDIPADDPSSLSLADQLMKHVPNAQFIFMSDCPDTVFQCLPYHPLYFLRKEHINEEIRGAVHAFMRTRSGSNTSIPLHTTSGDIHLLATEIIYAESNAHYLNLYCKNDTYRIRGKLSDYYPRLIPYGFIHPAKSFLVNCRYIRYFRTNEIETTTGVCIPVSRRQKAQARNAYLSYIRCEYP